MSEPGQPKKRGFQPGNKFGKGRPKGIVNRLGPSFREKLLSGIVASGEKKAKKNGVNGKIDGFSYFIEQLVDGNGGAAATLLAKMIPPELPLAEAAPASIMVNVVAVAEGQQFSPGGPDARILLPIDMLDETWAAYHGGPETWRTYLQVIEPMLTQKAFERLSHVVPLERARLPAEPALRLVSAAEPVEPDDA